MAVSFQFETRVYNFENPQFGNRNDLSFERISKRTRGNSLIIVGDGVLTEVLVLPFTFSLEAEKKRMLAMLKETIGEIGTYTDHEGQDWSGVIRNPEAQAVQNGRNGHSIEIQFEGDMI